MKRLFQGTSLFVIIGFLIFIATVFLVFRVGNAYRLGLGKIGQTQSEEPLLSKKKNIQKITFKKANEVGCIEVTPDGVVRVYSECAENLTDANRLTDTKSINELYRLLSIYDLSKYKKKAGGRLYEMTIETDEGTETFYLPIDGSTSKTVNDIIDTIEEIKEDLPQPSPSAGLQPSPSQGISPNPSASVSSTSPYPSSSAGVGGGSVEQPFTCEFTDSGGSKRPYNVSNVICSTEPSTAP